MAKYGVLVYGPGWVAGEHIKAYCRNPLTEIRCIVGSIEEDKERASRYMKEFGFEADFSMDFSQAVKRDDVQVVSICTISSLHFEPALEAIRAGKHVLVEKPVCLRPEELDVLVDAARSSSVKTMVGHVARWYPAVRNTHRYVEEGKLGRIFYGEADYWHEVHGAWKSKVETSGSALLMGGCHAVDLLRWFMGMERRVVEVHAYGNGPYRRKDFEFFPNIAGILKFEDGAMGKIGCSLESSMPYVFHYQFMGTDGCIRNNNVFLMSEGDKSKGFSTVEGKSPDDPDVSHHPFPEEIDYFISCIEKDEEPDVSIPRSEMTYRIVFAMEESARRGGMAVPVE